MRQKQSRSIHQQKEERGKKKGEYRKKQKRKWEKVAENDRVTL